MITVQNIAGGDLGRFRTLRGLARHVVAHQRYGGWDILEGADLPGVRAVCGFAAHFARDGGGLPRRSQDWDRLIERCVDLDRGCVDLDRE